MARRLIIISGIVLAVAAGLWPAIARAEGDDAPPAMPAPPISEAPEGFGGSTDELMSLGGKAREGKGPLPSVDEDKPPAKPKPTKPARPAPVDEKFHKARADNPPQPASPQPQPQGGEGADAAIPLLLPPEHLQSGPQGVGLTVEVQAPAVVNLNLEAEVKVIVRNTGRADVSGVVVRDVMPEGLQFLNSQPECSHNGLILTWKLGTVAAGSEHVLRVKVKPTAVKPMDHVAVVSILAGAKARTIVKQPKLEVKQRVSSSTVLKGQRVRFIIAVSNPGTGPARDVTVQVRLSPGLRHQEGNVIEQVLGVIGPGETVTLNTAEDLVEVEAVAGGVQTCDVSVSSPDVSKDAAEARVVQEVTVIEPRLKLTLSGHPRRITGTPNLYRLAVENPGTAPAHRVRLTAYLPLGGRLLVPRDAAYDPSNRRLSWTIAQLDPKEKVEREFKVIMGGVGRYQVDAQATADGLLSDKGSIPTDVTGMADVQYNVVENSRAIDVGEETEFEVRIKNQGTKDATNLLVGAKLSDHLKVVATAGTDESAKANPADPTELIFPAIKALAPKAELVLAIKVKADKPGIATCRVTLLHDDLGGSKLSRETPVTVMEGRP